MSHGLLKSGPKRLKLSSYVSRQLHLLEDIAQTISQGAQYSGSFTFEYFMKPHKGLSHLKSLLSDSFLKKTNFSEINYTLPTIMRNIFFKDSADDIHQMSGINLTPILQSKENDLKNQINTLLPIDAIINMKMFIHNSIEREELKKYTRPSRSTASVDTIDQKQEKKINNNLVQHGIKRSKENPVSDEEIIRFISNKVANIDPEFRRNFRFTSTTLVNIISGMFNRFDEELYEVLETSEGEDIEEQFFAQQVEDQIQSLLNLWSPDILEEVFHDIKLRNLRRRVQKSIKIPTKFLHNHKKLSQIEIDYIHTVNQLQRIKKKTLKPDMLISFTYTNRNDGSKESIDIPVEVKRPRISDIHNDKLDEMIHQVVEQSLFSLSKFGYLTDSVSYFAMVEILGYDAVSKKVEVSVKSIPFVKDDIDESGESILTPEALITYGFFKTIDATLLENHFVLATLMQVLPQSIAEERGLISKAYQDLIKPTKSQNIFFPEVLRERFETNYDAENLTQSLIISSDEFSEIFKDKRNQHAFDRSAISDRFGEDFQVQITLVDRLHKFLNPDEYHSDEYDFEEEDEMNMLEGLLEVKSEMLKSNAKLNDPLVTSRLICMRSTIDDTIFGAGFGTIEIIASEESQKRVYEGLMMSDELLQSYLNQLLVLNKLGCGQVRKEVKPEIINGKVYLNIGWLKSASSQDLEEERKELMDIKNGLKKLEP